MGYIQELRRLVGHRPLILAGACALVFNTQGQLLMLHRTDNACWGIPGGAMEPGESAEQTARREALEEAGITLGELELAGVFSGAGLYYQYPNGDQVHNVTIAYRCRQFTGVIHCADGEHDQAQFFDPGALPEAVSPSIRPILKALLDASAGRPII